MDLALNAAGGDSVGKLGMTMSAIAYLKDANAISQALATNPLTKGRWSLVWYGLDPSKDWDANQVYVAKDGVTGQLAIVIRGSVTDPWTWAFWYDWFVEDFSAFHQADWPYGGAPAGARISQGSLKGLNKLLAIRGTNNQTLGGALCYVLAPYLHQEIGSAGSLDYWPITFAAPTAGNPVFANWLISNFASDAGRYHNTQDVVPHAWNGIKWILGSYQPKPKIPDVLYGLVDAVRLDLELRGDHYQQPGAGIPLNGTVVVTDDWVQEAGHQHASTTYLSLLGVTEIPAEVPAPPTGVPAPSASTSTSASSSAAGAASASGSTSA
jgi:triacylglycerol lipase